jgi:NAD(P)-dependent dehydrogenase (short-subunit alcohol dehydrogenase family)
VFAAEDPAGHRRSLAEVFRLVQQEAERLSTAATPKLIVVARVDGRLGTGGAAVADLAGLAGALRCLARERPGLEARFVDIDPALGPDAAARAVVAELVTDGGPDAVGVGAGWRMAMRASPLAPAPRAAVLSGGDLVLVTGGARGVTALCAAALARETGARLLLAGRSAPPTPEPDWARGANGRDLRRRAAEAVGGALGAIEAACRAVEAGREIAATLCAAGISATYLQVDITDPAATAAALAPWRAEVTAVVHGAGVLADKPFATIRPTDLDAVLGPKLDGLDAVLAALPEARLRRIALFSSVAAAFGNEGQGAYALANEALNRRVHALARRYPDGLVASINWGPWRGGMVDETLAQRFAQRGTALLEPEAGAAAFLDVVLSEGVGPLEVVIGDAPGAPAVRAVAARA